MASHTPTQGPSRLIVELAADGPAAAAMIAGDQPAGDMTARVETILDRAGVRTVDDVEPVLLPALVGHSPLEAGFDESMAIELADDPGAASVIVVVEGGEETVARLEQLDEVRGVFVDLPIEPCLICPGSPPMGNTADVARLICAQTMRARGMTGQNVLLAIVDTGINRAHLAGRGLTPAMDAARSWVPAAGMTPFDAPVGHGTMCAFDALIGAPRATLLDIQLLRAGGSTFGAFLSHALVAYAHLQRLMRAPTRPGETRSLVVNNSWGMFHPEWDFPVGHASNYSDNPNHPFNRSVAALEALGADILFAAGNCGADCPDGRCRGVTDRTIYGANGHPSVLTVAGVDVSRARVGYSSRGPGRLARQKPDIAGYTHFAGSGVYPADGGTSAACPVVAGVVAAARTRRPFVPGNPAAAPRVMRDLVRQTATDISPTGFDFGTGFGVVNGCNLSQRLGLVLDDLRTLCRRYPELCGRDPVRLLDFCRRHPRLCEGLRRPDFPPPRPDPGPRRPGLDDGGNCENREDDRGMDPSAEPDAEGEDAELAQLMANLWQMGYEDGRRELAGEGGGRSSRGNTGGSKGCDCG